MMLSTANQSPPLFLGLGLATQTTLSKTNACLRDVTFSYVGAIWCAWTARNVAPCFHDGTAFTAQNLNCVALAHIVGCSSMVSKYRRVLNSYPYLPFC